MKKYIFVLFIVISLIIIYNFGQSVYRLLSKKDLLLQAQNELKKVQKENTELKKQIAHVNNQHFVEEQARDKLFLVKPGENTVVIPSAALPTPVPQKVQIKEKPHWQEWIEVFFR